MSFYDEMRDYVLHHGAINNPYLDRFKSGSLTDAEFKSFAVEFYNFARFFPKILVSQLVTTEDEAVAAVAGNDPKKAMTSQQRGDFRRGTKAVLDYLEGFWMGLEASRTSRAA